MIMKPAVPTTEEDVLLAFTAEANQDRTTLESYLARHPQHAEALTQLAVELMLAPERPALACQPDAPAIDQAWNTFQSTLPVETKSLGTVGSLLAALSPTAFRTVAKELDVSPLFLSLVRDRAIQFSTIPRKFIEALAAALSATFEALTHDLQQQPMIAATQKFKADGKPEASDKISFTEAVALSHLTDDQQAKLKALME